MKVSSVKNLHSLHQAVVDRTYGCGTCPPSSQPLHLTTPYHTLFPHLRWLCPEQNGLRPMGRLSYAPVSMSYSAATLVAMPGSVGVMRVLMCRDHVIARVGEVAPPAPSSPPVGGRSAMCVAIMPVEERPVGKGRMMHGGVLWR